jgi:uncharacterized repeat protein (TIGR01451 family)
MGWGSRGWGSLGGLMHMISQMPRLAASIFLLVMQLFFAQVAWAQSADLIVNKTGPTSASNGQAFTYVLQIRNAGPNAADGATYSDPLPAGLLNVTAVCQNPTNGAVCAAPSTVTNALVSGSIPTLPDQGTVEIAITGNFPGLAASSYRNEATVAVPTGVIETNATSNISSINTTITYLPTDVAVTKTQSAAALVIGTQHTYTVTFTNVSANPADGTTILDNNFMPFGLTGALSTTGYTYSCVSSSGSVPCPAAYSSAL